MSKKETMLSKEDIIERLADYYCIPPHNEDTEDEPEYNLDDPGWDEICLNGEFLCLRDIVKVLFYEN